jgi:hypothetical protein
MSSLNLLWASFAGLFWGQAAYYVLSGDELWLTALQFGMAATYTVFIVLQALSGLKK